MPKRIEDLRETILQNTKTILLNQGCEKLTIRSVAAVCHVAVGTVYNYFPSKDILIASVMVEDWEDALEQMRVGCDGAQNCTEGMQCIFETIRSFSVTYSVTWERYRPQTSIPTYVQARHRQLLAQLSGVVKPLLERFVPDPVPHLARFVTEALLSGASDPDTAFAEMRPALEKLIQ